jgi:hypothetical protein
MTDEKIFEILGATNMTEYDVQRHFKNGVYVYEAEDVKRNAEEYYPDLEPEDYGELRQGIDDMTLPASWSDCDLVVVDGITYFISYCL